MHIVYVGYPGFPVGHAQVERQKLIAKGLEANSCKVTIICRYGTQEEGSTLAIPEEGEHEGIRYQYASGLTFRPNGFLKRNFYKLKGLVQEACLILKYKSEHKLDAVFITTNSFFNVALYCGIAYLCRVPSVLDNVEYWSSRTGVGLWERLDNYLYDQYAYKCASKVICISDFLLNIVKTGSPDKPVIKVPTIVDFSKFQQKDTSQEPYFLFCGSAVYYEIIDFIIEAFEQLEHSPFQLYLVSNGTSDQINRIYNRIGQSSKKTSIKHYSGLSYEALTQMYISSKALLIPLLNREQDIARFPHKIGEYCASRKVIVSTKVGEIASYFKDRENALIASDAVPASFSLKMQHVINFPEEANMIAERSFHTGRKEFDHIKLGRKIFDFVKTAQRQLGNATYSYSH